MERIEAACALRKVAERVVTDQVAPAAVAGCAQYTGAWRAAFGAAGALWPTAIAPEPPSVSVETVFDLASLTKPVTALTVARLERAFVLRRDEPLGELLGAALPDLRRTASADVTLDLLLAHRAGLVAHNPFYESLLQGRRPTTEEVLLAAASMRREGCEGAPPADGFEPVYSDLGYLLVGAAIEARTGVALDALAAREVGAALELEGADVLGSARQLREQGLAAARLAPTEVVPWRGGLVHGTVHDENAWLVAGEGMAGHAGLFGTVGAVVALGRAVLDGLGRRNEWLRPDELAPLVRSRPGGSLAGGFDRRSEVPGAVPSSGAHFSAATFGHLGFTGTSIWMDPTHQLVGVLLTNRVCPTREHLAIRAARPVAYDAMFAAMTGDHTG